MLNLCVALYFPHSTLIDPLANKTKEQFRFVFLILQGIESNRIAGSFHISNCVHTIINNRPVSHHITLS